MKITNIEFEMIKELDLSQISGGNSCRCGCYYRNVGGSSISGNGQANYGGGSNGKKSFQRTSDEMYIIDCPDGETRIW